MHTVQVLSEGGLQLESGKEEEPVDTVAVRIPREAHAEIRRMAKQRHETVGQVVMDMVADQKRRECWEAYQQAALEARNNPELWRQMQEEQQEFDGSLMDSLE